MQTMQSQKEKDSHKMEKITAFIQKSNDEEFMNELISECMDTDEIEDKTKEEVDKNIRKTCGSQILKNLDPSVGNAFAMVVNKTSNEEIRQFINDFKVIFNASNNRGAINYYIKQVTGSSFAEWFGLPAKA